MLHAFILHVFLAFLSTATAAPARFTWPSWGGPNGDFTIDAKELPPTFAANPPKRLWQRDLGEGYSAIVSDGTWLYTMYRRGNDEVVGAFDPQSGETKWEYAYNASFRSQMGMENGPGPHATPLLLGDYVYTVGILAQMHAFHKKTGKIVWSKDLYKDFPASTFMERGYASSPIAYKNAIIVKLGGNGHAVVALNPKDGSLLWQKQSFSNSSSSCIIINVDGQEQLITTFSEEVVGLNPANGDLLWRYPHKTSWGLNISTPLWGPGNLIFVSSAYNGGARVLHLSQSGGQTKVDELWNSNRMRVHHTNAVRVGDYIYASSGAFGPAPMTAVAVKTGKVAWQDRTFGKVNLVLVGDKAILLDEGGDLALASLSPQGMNVRWRVSLLKSNAWTAPTLVGTRLYVRDRKSMLALDLE